MKTILRNISETLPLKKIYLRHGRFVQKWL